MEDYNLGLELARLARMFSYHPLRIAKYTGATRGTVYNWFLGKGVSNAYRTKAERLVVKLQAKEQKP